MLIDNNYEFINAIKENRGVILKTSGEWKVLTGISRFCSKISSLFGSTEIVKTANTFSKILDDLEKIPVHVNSQHGEAPEQQVDFAKYISAAKAVSQSMKTCKSEKTQMARLGLKRRITALQYRLESAEGGVQPAPKSVLQPQEKSEFTERIKKWKEKIVPQNPTITESDEAVIDKLCCHKKFYKLLMKDSRLFTEFAKWTIRDGNSIDIFIQYAGVQNFVSSSAISARLGRCSHEALRIEVNKNNEKIVTIPIVLGDDQHVERLSVLDRDLKVAFSENYSLTINQIFKVFADRKNSVIGNLEVFEKGITNWNPQYWTRFDGINHEKFDINQNSWWEKLPTYKSYSIEQAKSTFGDDLDGKNWKVFACATRQGKKLDFEGNHGYMLIVIPTEDGKYRAYPFGKFAKTYPKTFFEKLSFLTKTVPASLFYLDENVYMSHRENWGYPFTISSEKGLKLMESIRKDKIESDKANGNFYFQLEGANCANWVQTTLEKVLGKEESGGMVPNLYQIPILQVEPQNLLFKPVFCILRKCPQAIQRIFMKAANLLLGAWQSYKHVDENGNKRKISIMNSLFWDRQEIYHPAALPKRFEGKCRHVRA